jgi:hypothetical protein
MGFFRPREKDGGVEIDLLLIELDLRRNHKCGPGLIFTTIFKQSKYQAMNIVLTAAVPSVTLRVQPFNSSNPALPAIDTTTGLPTLVKGSLQIAFDAPGVSWVSDPTDEFLVTFTKTDILTATVNAQALATNESGTVLTSDVLSVSLNPVVAVSGIATGIMWASVGTATNGISAMATVAPKELRH